jgi:hypothetical protein
METYLERKEIDGERSMYIMDRNKYGAMPQEKRWLKVTNPKP